MNSCLFCNSTVTSHQSGARIFYDCPTCSEVVLSSSIVPKIEALDDKSLLSIYFRRNRRKSHDTKLLHRNNFDQAIDEIKSVLPSSVVEAQNKVIEYFGRKSDVMGSWVRSDYNTHLDIVIQKESLRFICDSLIKDRLLDVKHPDGNYLAKGELRLTMDGWNRFDKIYRQQLNSMQAFIAMNFDKSCLEIWHKGILPAFENTPFKPYRVDEDRHLENINNKIIAEIRKSRFVVAEFTGHKHGVYFEAGFAMGLGIPVIWICRESDFDKTHFDTKHFNHIVWKDYEELKEELRWFIKANIK